MEDHDFTGILKMINERLGSRAMVFAVSLGIIAFWTVFAFHGFYVGIGAAVSVFLWSASLIQYQINEAEKKREATEKKLAQSRQEIEAAEKEIDRMRLGFHHLKIHAPGDLAEVAEKTIEYEGITFTVHYFKPQNVGIITESKCKACNGAVSGSSTDTVPVKFYISCPGCEKREAKRPFQETQLRILKIVLG